MPQNERGATLVVALIILLVMTIIGVSSMKSSTLQERMAGNARQKTIAKNAAMVAMNEAEVWLTTSITRASQISQFNGSGALFSAVSSTLVGKSEVDFDTTDPVAWLNEGVASTSMTTINTANTNDSHARVVRQPRYIIEYLGRDVKGASGNLAAMIDIETQSNKDLSPYFFRVSAIGWGKDTNIYSVLESTFMTGSDSNFYD